MRQILNTIFFLFSIVLFSQNQIASIIYFDTDNFVLNKEQSQKIKNFVTINHTKIKSIEVKGFSDDRGTNAYNYDLAKKRVASVSASIKALNLDIKSKIIKKSFGEVSLKSIKNADFERAKNRKVEIILYLEKEIPFEKIRVKKTKIDKKNSVFSINGQNQRRETNNKIKDSLKSIKNEVYSEALQKHFEQVFKTNNQEVKFKDILFIEGWRISVRNEYYQYLYNLALFLKSHPYYSIELWGYYASIKKFNERIKEDKKIFGKKASEVVARGIISCSIGRAKYVYFYLKNKGVNEKQLSYKTGLIKPKKITQEKYRDIRVEIKIVNK